MHLIFAFVFSVFATFVHAEDHHSNYFTLTSISNEDGTHLNWDIGDGYYLLANKIIISPPGSADFTVSQLPTPNIIKDDFLGEISIYTDKLSLIVSPVAGNKSNVNFSVEYQGCTDKSQCYPLITKDFSIEPPSIQLNETDKIAALLQQDNIFLVLASFFGI